MKKRLTVILMILLVLGSITTACQSNESTAEAPEVGKRAPSFQLNTLDGQPVSLSDFQGKPVLVNFWATWCNPCVHEMPFIQQVYEERQGEELVLLAINIGESPSQAAEFMQSYGFSFPVLLDGDTALAQRYNIQYIPTTLLIDREGIIQEIKVGSFQSKAEIESILSKLE